ncbi:MAG: hypothetical protein ACE5Q6_09405 [Dehalococcoidia bacterium]
MLYKVFMENAFREDPDLVGFIQAPDIDDAVDVLAVEVGSNWADERLPRFTRVKVNVDQSRLEATSTDEDGQTGRDVYVGRRQAAEVCLFHARDWNLLFRQ